MVIITDCCFFVWWLRQLLVAMVFLMVWQGGVLGVDGGMCGLEIMGR